LGTKTGPMGLCLSKKIKRQWISARVRERQRWPLNLKAQTNQLEGTWQNENLRGKGERVRKEFRGKDDLCNNESTSGHTQSMSGEESAGRKEKGETVRGKGEMHTSRFTTRGGGGLPSNGAPRKTEGQEMGGQWRRVDPWRGLG